MVLKHSSRQLLVAVCCYHDHYQPISNELPRYLGSQHKYRSPDGSFNNIFIPDLGKANTPYARSVPPVTLQQGQLPDAGFLFDTIFRRQKGKAKEHPNKISSMLFYFATIIIHDLFRTDHDDQNMSTTSSYLDLAPLYGSNEEEQRQMRTGKDGRIKIDCFSEKRIHGFPPGVSVLLIMFNRFHNHVVENLAAINEDGRFNKEGESYDEDLFQVGRLVTCGLYVNIVLNDYIRTIVNLVRTKSTWKIDPRKEVKHGPARGVGNQVSAEFNLIYRWHAVVSERDAEWIEETYKKTFKHSPSEISVPEMIQQLNHMEEKMSKDPTKQPILNQSGNKVHRDPATGKLDDDELVTILSGSIEDCANAFGANQVPDCLRVVEIMGIEQSRKWQVCTLNEFRKFFDLTPYKNFEDINPDIAEDLRHLYHTVDQVELYPGIICESTKEPRAPGSGLAPGFTISRAILSDAVTLVRGDRFHTVDYHPKLLTNWGYTEADSDPNVDYGCCFYKLFFTSFPQHFKRNSVYAHFPLTIPGEMERILGDLGNGHNYSYTQPHRLPNQVEITSFKGVKDILKDTHTFRVAWREAVQFLMGPQGQNYMLAGEGQEHTRSRRIMDDAIYSPNNWEEEIRQFYLTKTQALLDEKKHQFSGLPGQYVVDLIHDVTNIVHVYFAAEMFLLPLKSHEHPHAPFTEQELYLIFCGIFICVFFDVDAERSFQVHEQARKAATVLGKILKENAQSLRLSRRLSLRMQRFLQRNERSRLSEYGERMIQRVLDDNPNVDPQELVGVHILGTASGMVPNQGQQFAEMLEFYLFDPEGKKHWDDIVETARGERTPENEERLLRYVMEGSRLACGSAVLREVRKDAAQVHGDAGVVDSSNGKKIPKNGSITLKRDDKVFVNLWKASRDPEVYKNPHKVDLNRNMDDYVCFGWGAHQCLGLNLIKISLTAVLRVVASLPHLRPAPGPEGRIKRVPANVEQSPNTAEGYWKYMTADYGMYFPFPTGMKVIWEEEWDNSRGSTSNGVAVNEHATNGVTVNGHAANGVSTNGANGTHTDDGTDVEADEPPQANGNVNGHTHTNGTVNGHHNGTNTGTKKRKAHPINGTKKRPRY